jgi:glutathione S-transferase
MLKIYGRANSLNVRKVLWVADEIGLQYQREDWGRGYRPTNSPEFLKLNPVGLVPVIDDEGFVLRESNTIVRYLAAKHNRTDLYPADLKTRATVEAWMDWGATEFFTPSRPLFMGLIVKVPAFDDPKLIENAATEWSKQMGILDHHLAEKGPYLMGKDFTVADIPAGVLVNRWYTIEFPKSEFKAVAAYYDRLAARPGYRTHVRNGLP